MKLGAGRAADPTAREIDSQSSSSYSDSGSLSQLFIDFPDAEDEVIPIVLLLEAISKLVPNSDVE
jgi:hypothetical protein